MSTTIIYKRWDGVDIYYDKELQDDTKGQITFSCNELEHIKDSVIYKVGDLQINKEELRKMEMFTGKDGATRECYKIDSIAGYLNAIDLYRLQSVLIHIRAFADGELKEFLDIKIADTKSLKKILEERKVVSELTNNIIDKIQKSSQENPIYCSFNFGIKEDFLAFVKHVMHIFDNGGSYCYYRGIGQIYWPEVPSIFRPNLDKHEGEWYRKMKIEFPDQMDNRPYLDRLTLLQHFGLPTRLLDVSANPLVALYMAVNKIYTHDEEQLEDGEVIVYFTDYDYNPSTSEENVDFNDDTEKIGYDKSYDSTNVLAIAALAKLEDSSKKIMYEIITNLKEWVRNHSHSLSLDCKKVSQAIDYCIHTIAANTVDDYLFTAQEREQVMSMIRIDVRSTSDFCSKTSVDFQRFNRFMSSYRYLLTTIRRENPAFVDHLHVFNLLKAYHVSTGFTNERIRAQMGSSIVCGLDKDYINEKMACSRRNYSIRLIITDKQKIFRELNAIGINDATMMPDMSHHTAYLLGNNI